MDTEELKRDFMRCLLARPTATEAEKIATRMVNDITGLIQIVSEEVTKKYIGDYLKEEGR